ncbi:MAG: hypothetical protein ACW98F_17355 [Candidatus Hodarchaeales archaeon]
MTTNQSSDPVTAQKPRNIRCGLCGYTFRIDNCDNLCEGCSSSFSCNLLKCPNCGYSFPPLETSMSRLLKRLIHKISGISR